MSGWSSTEAFATRVDRERVDKGVYMYILVFGDGGGIDKHFALKPPEPISHPNASYSLFASAYVCYSAINIYRTVIEMS